MRLHASGACASKKIAVASAQESLYTVSEDFHKSIAIRLEARLRCPRALGESLVGRTDLYCVGLNRLQLLALIVCSEWCGSYDFVLRWLAYPCTVGARDQSMTCCCYCHPPEPWSRRVPRARLRCAQACLCDERDGLVRTAKTVLYDAQKALAIVRPIGARVRATQGRVEALRGRLAKEDAEVAVLHAHDG